MQHCISYTSWSSVLLRQRALSTHIRHAELLNVPRRPYHSTCRLWSRRPPLSADEKGTSSRLQEPFEMPKESNTLNPQWRNTKGVYKRLLGSIHNEPSSAVKATSKLWRGWRRFLVREGPLAGEDGDVNGASRELIRRCPFTAKDLKSTKIHQQKRSSPAHKISQAKLPIQQLLTRAQSTTADHHSQHDGSPFQSLMAILWKPRISHSEWRQVLATAWDHLTVMNTGKENQQHVAHIARYRDIFPKLLRHAQNVDAAALPSIAHLLGLYCKLLASGRASDDGTLPTEIHHRLSSCCNEAIYHLSRPPTDIPFLGMAYAWEAQQIILQIGESYNPALTLDQKAYKAIISVLLANPKTQAEAEAAGHVHRSWPPWRKVIHGVDAKKDLSQEVTRPIAVQRNMQAGGYLTESWDMIAAVLAGKDKDFTPTIPTRSILNDTVPGLDGDARALAERDLEWAARVRATRDVEEAWAAFCACLDRGLILGPKVFGEMFAKLVYEDLRIKGKRPEPLISGEGREVFGTQYAALTEAELARIRPPSIGTLLNLAETLGVALHSSTIALLIQHAVSIGFAWNVIRRFGDKHRSARGLKQPNRLELLDQLDDRTFRAYLSLLCRLASYDKLDRSARSRLSHPQELLEEAIDLLKRRGPRASRNTWQTVFKGMALPKQLEPSATLAQNVCYDLQSAGLWWRRMVELYNDDFSKTGHALNPDGFQILCIGFYEALDARNKGYHLADQDITDGTRMLSILWHDVSGEGTSVPHMPRLKYRLHGSHIHAWIRVLGALTQNTSLHGSTVDANFTLAEYTSLLRWMEVYSGELSQMASLRANGMQALRLCLIAIKTFAEQHPLVSDDTLVQMASLANSISEEWGGWPSEKDAETYVANSRDGRERGSARVGDRKDIEELGADPTPCYDAKKNKLSKAFD